MISGAHNKDFLAARLFLALYIWPRRSILMYEI